MACPLERLGYISFEMTPPFFWDCAWHVLEAHSSLHIDRRTDKNILGPRQNRAGFQTEIGITFLPLSGPLFLESRFRDKFASIEVNKALLYRHFYFKYVSVYVRMAEKKLVGLILIALTE